MRLAGLVLLAGLLAGCATWQGEPLLLDFPSPPPLTFRSDGSGVCLSAAEADRLAKWIDQLHAFRRARERLRQPLGVLH